MSPTGEGTDSSTSTTRLKEKKLEKSSGFPQYLLYLWQNFQCKFAPQPIGSALLALPLTVRP